MHRALAVAAGLVMVFVGAYAIRDARDIIEGERALFQSKRTTHARDWSWYWVVRRWGTVVVGVLLVAGGVAVAILA